MFWLLIYVLVDDYLERRAALRSEHLEPRPPPMGAASWCSPARWPTRRTRPFWSSAPMTPA